MDRKIYHLEFKASGFNFYYGDLTILCNTWGKNLKVSKFTLDRWDFEKPYENENIIIYKTKLITSKRQQRIINKNIIYKGYLIEPNNTGYVNFDFYKPESEFIDGNGETIEDCKRQIDNL